MNFAKTENRLVKPKRPHHILRRTGRTVLSVLVTLLAANVTAIAADYLSPGVSPESSYPPPPGSGATPPQLTQGDGGALPPLPSGQAITPPVHGTNFKHEPEKARTFSGYYLNQDGRGRRQIMRTPAEGPARDFERKEDLQRYNDRYYPYPGTEVGRAFQKKVPDENGRPKTISWPTKGINKDKPNEKSNYFGRNKPNKDWTKAEDTEAPLPIVKPFCRKIVILGVVFATVFMAFAAFSVVLGHKDSGQRVIGAAAGLMLLLMGYSIYKVVQINAWRFFEGGDFDWTSPTFEHERTDLKPSDTPVVPLPPRGQKRSNLPVEPYGAQLNR